MKKRMSPGHGRGLCFMFHLVFRYCLLNNSKGMWSVKKLCHLSLKVHI